MPNTKKLAKLNTLKIGILALVLLIQHPIITANAAVPPPPELHKPADGSLFTIEDITLGWDTIPHDNGYYWVAWSRAEAPDWWIGPDNSRVAGTEYTLTKNYVQQMVYGGKSDTFYWRVTAEVDVSYYWPESWSPPSIPYSFSVLKWPAAWIDSDYWENSASDANDEIISVRYDIDQVPWGSKNGRDYNLRLSSRSPDTGWWEPVGSGTVPVTSSTSAHLSWTDRSSDKTQKSVAFADQYRVQISTAASFDDVIHDTKCETINYDTPPLQPGAYYWRVRSETDGGLVSDWNAPRKFIIALAPTAITCQISSDLMPVGGSATISGSITPPIPGCTVTISYSAGSSSNPSNVLGTATCGADGSYTYKWTPTTPELYYIKASWSGDATRGGATSKATVVDVRTLNVYLYVSPSQTTQGSPVTVSGSLSPAIPSASVELRYVKPDGSILTRSATTDEKGDYTDTYSPDKAGTWSVSAKVENIVSASEEFEVKSSGVSIPGYPLAAVILGVAAVLLAKRRPRFLLF